jgi:hypothetical protein
VKFKVERKEKKGGRERGRYGIKEDRMKEKKKSQCVWMRVIFVSETAKC